ncbi:MAG: glutaredoxin family protein, partial [Burkholderiales bacterium]
MRTPDRTLALALALCALAAPAAAQYKWVAPNGAITYSDQPPPPGMTGGALGPAGVALPDEGGIPVALRDASSKYPVVLYTAADCTPCQEARTHLSKRGVPYAEKSISTSKDVEAFKRVGFTENSFPAITVGREKLIGFEAEGWNRLLDAAGYPKTSVLPASWRPPAAQPLAAPKPA